jgi:hypothetical protein
MSADDRCWHYSEVTPNASNGRFGSIVLQKYFEHFVAQH